MKQEIDFNFSVKTCGQSDLPKSAAKTAGSEPSVLPHQRF